ncbi:hypothetical protein [Psychrobacter sp.]|uniref:hypothetical protein n=1 Tax=Psychrobacter sp. TaxID=56811 RepID=UPI0025EFE922|nr:hypothetical protein [Psychrobacter sp.]
MNSKYLIRTTLVLSIILMVILLPLDAYCANDGCTKSYVSLVFGIFGIFIGGNETLTWYANPLLFLAWLFLLIRKPKLSLILSIVSTLVALSFLTFDEIVINEAGHQAPITKYALGYWLWIGSHTIMVIGNVFILLYEHHSSFKNTSNL